MIQRVGVRAEEATGRIRSSTIQVMKFRAMPSDAVPDIAGITAAGLASGAVVAALDRMQVVSQPWALWLIALPLLVVASVGVWHGSERTRHWDSKKWGRTAIVSLLCGATFFGLDVLVGGSDGHYKTFIEAASHSGLLGLPVTILICPVGTIVALGGWLRCMVEEGLEANSQAPS